MAKKKSKKELVPEDEEDALPERATYSGKNKLRRFFDAYKKMLISGLVAFVLTFAVMSALFCRSYAIGVLKNHFEELEKDLQSIGYDYAYDEINFYLFSPWQIMRAKNFRIYSLDDADFKQITFKELNVNVGIWNINKVRIYIGSQLSLQRDKSEKDVVIGDSEVLARVKKGRFKELTVSIEGISIHNLMTINDVYFQLKHQRSPVLSAKLDIKGTHIDDMTGWPLNKQIDHIYLFSSVLGYIDEDMTFGESFYDWIDHGGYIAIHKGILNWKPFIMVANGDVRFNEKDEVSMSLNTASLAMLETLDALSENRLVSRKGAYVVKLLLNNKGIKQNPTDEYETIVSSIKYNKDGWFLENIKLR